MGGEVPDELWKAAVKVVSKNKCDNREINLLSVPGKVEYMEEFRLRE